jgi:hypothetical protein
MIYKFRINNIERKLGRNKTKINKRLKILEKFHMRLSKNYSIKTKNIY